MAKATNVTPNIFERAVCVSINRGCLGITKRVSSHNIQEKHNGEGSSHAPVEVEADKTLVRVSKKLLDSPEYEAIKKLDSTITQYINSRALPSMFRGGIYMISYDLLEELEDKLADFKQERQKLVEDFLAAYPQRVSEIDTRLGGLSDPLDHPPIGKVRSAFYFDWQFFEVGLPGRLKTVSTEIYRREQQKAAAHWTQATAEIQVLLRASLKDLVDHMVEILQPGENGKPRKIFRSSVTKLHDFLDNFKARNITDDAEVQRLVDQAKDLMVDVNVDLLRDHDGTRRAIQDGFSKIKSNLDSLVQDRPKRKITFDDQAA